MQELTLIHWTDQLAEKLQRAANATAACMREVAIRDIANTDAANGTESVLHDLKLAAESLKELRGASSADKIIKSLKTFGVYVGSAEASVSLFLKDAVKNSASNEARASIATCISVVGELVDDVNQFMDLPEVREARLNARAKAAKSTAREIEAMLQST